MRRLLAAAVIAAVATVALAHETPSPEACLAPAGGSVVTVAHAGKTYHLANEACRAEFLTDPERYSQLYDALTELAAEGTSVLPPARTSLVPS